MLLGWYTISLMWIAVRVALKWLLCQLQTCWMFEASACFPEKTYKESNHFIICMANCQHCSTHSPGLWFVFGLTHIINEPMFLAFWGWWWLIFVHLQLAYTVYFSHVFIFSKVNVRIWHLCSTNTSKGMLCPCRTCFRCQHLSDICRARVGHAKSFVQFRKTKQLHVLDVSSS